MAVRSHIAQVQRPESRSAATVHWTTAATTHPDGCEMAEPSAGCIMVRGKAASMRGTRLVLHPVRRVDQRCPPRRKKSQQAHCCAVSTRLHRWQCWRGPARAKCSSWQWWDWLLPRGCCCTRSSGRRWVQSRCPEHLAGDVQCPEHSAGAGRAGSGGQQWATTTTPTATTGLGGTDREPHTDRHAALRQSR